MNLFTRLSAAAKSFTATVDENVVKVVRGTTPIEVQPGLTALEAAVQADHLDKDQEGIATFKITHIDGREEMVAGSYICQGGQTLTVIVNRDGKGA